MARKERPLLTLEFLTWTDSEVPQLDATLRGNDVLNLQGDDETVCRFWFDGLPDDFEYDVRIRLPYNEAPNG